MAERIERRIQVYNPERLAALALVFFAALTGLVYAWAFVRPANLVEVWRTAEPDFYALYGAGSLPHLSLVVGFLELGLFYLLAYRLAFRLEGPGAWALVIGASLAFGAVLMYVFPYDAADIFDYIIHGRMTGVYGVNPYTHIPKDFPSDPVLKYVAWKNDPSPYGPVWEHLAGLASRLAGNGVVANVWAYKLIPGLFLLGSIVLVALILRKLAPEYALPGTLLVAWNPVILYETWGNGHNDMVMVFWLLAAILAMVHRRYTLVMLALTMGALVKYLPVLLVPAAGLIALRELPDWRARASYALRTGLACLALAALIYLPFWEGPQVLTVLNRTNLFTSTIPATAYYLLQTHLSKEAASTLVSRIALVVTLAFALWQAIRAWRDRSPHSFTHAAFNILVFYLLVTCLWFQQWYTVWVIALVPLLRPGPLRELGLVVGFAALSKQLVAGPFLFYPTYRFVQPYLEIIFTLAVLGIPWIYSLVSLYRIYRRPRAVSLTTDQ